MNVASESVTAFATMIGIEPRFTPYHSHNATPSTKTTYIPSDTPWADRVFHVIQACGTKALVVRTAATKPMRSLGGTAPEM